MRILDYETPRRPEGPDWWGRLSANLAMIAWGSFFFLIFLGIVAPDHGTVFGVLAIGAAIALVGCAIFGLVSGIVSIARYGSSRRAVVGLFASAFLIVLLFALQP
jgi:hypothetical protein